MVFSTDQDLTEGREEERDITSHGSAVPQCDRSKRSRTQKHADVRKKMSANERKGKSAKERKRAQKSTKERSRVKIANNQLGVFPESPSPYV